MKFINIQNNVDQIETINQRTKASAALQKIFKENGNAVINDEKLLFSLIDSEEFSEAAKLRIKLVLNCTSVRNYLSAETIDLKMTQIDNMIHVICDETGLTYISAVETLSEILCALGLDYTIAYSPVLEENKVEHKIHTIMPPEIAKKEVLRVKKAFGAVESLGGDITEQESKSILNDINKLCSAGIPDGFYMLAKCYENGYLNTAKNLELYQEYITLAAEMGCPEAAGKLADDYYDSDSELERHFEEAFYYYTKPGSLALSKKQQENVEDIYRQKEENKKTLGFAIASTVLSIIFLIFFNKGIFSESSRLVVGIIFVVLSVIYDVLLFISYNKVSKFNSLRASLFLQYLAWMIFIFILELA